GLDPFAIGHVGLEVDERMRLRVRRWKGDAQDALIDENAAVYRVGIVGQRVRGEEPRLGQKAGALRRVQVDLLEVVAERSRQLVERSERLVHEADGRSVDFLDAIALVEDP